VAQLRSRLRRKHDGDQSGFTLIELLVVIIILGILSAVVVFAVRGTGDKGQSAAQATDVRTIRTAEEAYCAQKGFYAPDTQTLVAARLLSQDATLDSVRSAQTGTCGDGSKGPKGYTIVCSLSPTSNCAAAAAVGAAVDGGTMVLASGSLGGPYNPAATSSGSSHPLSEAMFNGLLAFDSAGNVVPDLAASMPTVTTNGDGTQDMVVTLRSGIPWHDSGVTTATNPAGAPQTVSAADVVFSYQFAILKGQGRTAGSMGPALGFDPTTYTFTGGSVTATGPLTVKFHFLYAYSLIAFQQMNVTEAAIIPQHVYAHCAHANGGGTGISADTLNGSSTNCAENFAPVGSGPFVWSGQTTAQINAAGSITLNKNPNYFKAGLPYLSKIVLLNTSTAATALQASRSTSGSVDTAGISSTALTTPFNFSTSPDYSVASVPRGSGGANCINTISFNLWQPVPSTTISGTNFTLSEFAAGDPGISGGLPGNAPPMSQSAIVTSATNAPYNNPILSSFLVRKAMFEGFNRAQASINDTGLSNAVGAPLGTPRMADSIYNSKLPVAYSPTTFPGGTGASLGQPTVAQANTDLDNAGWDGPTATDSNGVTVRTWGNHPTYDQQARLGMVPGTQFKIDITHHYSASQPAISVQFVSDMKALGIDVIDRNVFTGSGSSISTQWPAVEGARNFEIGITSYCHGDDPVIGSQRQYVSSSIPTAFAANTSGYRDQGTTPGDGSMDGLWYQVNRAATPAARTALFGQIQTKELTTLSQIPVDETPSFRVTRNLCQGLNNQNTGLFVEAAYCR
jgi:prepilin-type N-terminal cleavage/methylation domain-containing protein